MVKKVTSTSKAKSKTTELKVQSTRTLPGGQLNNFLNNLPEQINKFKSSKSFYLVVLVIGIGLLYTFKKSWFVAATVNGMPITNLELQTKLNEQFRSQTLTQMINEKIIMSEASKNNAVPTPQEIDAKIADVEKSVGGKDTLDSLLAQQGQTRTSLRDQIRVQLAITKLYASEATVSAEEVAKYIQDNGQSMRATESAQQQIEATDAIKNQKLSQIFSAKFAELSKNAVIQKF